MSGVKGLLCEILSCGYADLEMLNDVGYYWSDVLDQADWPRNDLDFNILMRAVFSCGIVSIKEALQDRLMGLEAIDSPCEEELMELNAIQQLNPEKDIASYHNCLDTHIWFEKNGEVYRRYLKTTLDDFEDNTGFSITSND